MQERWRHGCAAVRALGGHSGGGPHLGLVNADLFELDLGPVDILFINSIVFNPAAQERLSARAARMLRPGARVVASSPLRGPRFEMLSEHVVPVTSPAAVKPCSTQQGGEGGGEGGGDGGEAQHAYEPLHDPEYPFAATEALLHPSTPGAVHQPCPQHSRPSLPQYSSSCTLHPACIHRRPP